MRRPWFWLLALYAASLLLIPLGRDEVLTYHEVACAQPAKEMLISGDWIVPTFAGVPCLHKPPLVHWLIAVSMRLAGSQSETAVRLPAALAGFLLCLVVALWAARWFGGLTGLVAGLVQVTSVHLQTQARLAETDIFLATAVAAALWFFALANIPGPAGLPARPKWLAAAFYLASALACLAKGPVGLILVLGPCLLHLLVFKDRAALRFLVQPTAVAVFLLAALPWFILAYRQYPPILQAWYSDNLVRYTTGFAGSTPPWYYLGSILWLLLPWTPFVGLGLVLSLPRLRGPGCEAANREGSADGEPGSRSGQRKSITLLVTWFLFGFAFFTASAWRSHHYLVPILPPLSIFASLGFLGWVNWRAQSGQKLFVPLLALVLLGGGTGLLIIENQMPPEQRVVLRPLVAILVLGLAVALLLEQRGHAKASLAATFSVAWIVILGAQLFVVPLFDIYADQVQLARRIAGRLPPGEPVYMVELPDNQIVFYLTQPVRREDRFLRFSTALPDAPGQLFVLSHASLAPQLEVLGDIEPIEKCRSVRPGRPEGERLTLFRLRVRRQTDS